ncbi:MAG: hypothetical protein R6X12_09690 [bacterium]
MSKYEEICAAYAKSRSAWEDHRQACWGMARDLVGKLADDIGAPLSEFCFLPPNVDYDPREVRPVETALEYGADGAFHFGLGLRLRPAPDHPFPEVLLIQLGVSRNPGGYELRMEGLNEPIRLPLEYGEPHKGHRAFIDMYARRAAMTYSEHDLRYTEIADYSRTMLR